MKIRFLLIGTSLSLIPQTINAQCVATQDCATLGYTETSCSGGSGVKCPFGNKWACFKSDSEIKDQLCTELGFTQACTGTNQTSGVGKVCNGKYSECTCANGYEWKDGSCNKITDGAVGDLFYCNGKVVAVKAPKMSFYVAMNDLEKNDLSSANASCQRYSFCNNLEGDLPTKKQLQSIYNNKSVVNSLLSTSGGTKLTEGSYWSSSYPGGGNNYSVNMSSGGASTSYSYNIKLYVRPVISSY